MEIRIVAGWFLLLALVAPPAFAVEKAPRISDREIIEGLAELKAGQKALQQQINDLKESTRQQIGDLRESTNRRFDVLQWMFGVFITLALAILGALWRILWHQQKRLSVIEATLETQKDEMAFIKGLIDKLLLARGVA